MKRIVLFINLLWLTAAYAKANIALWVWSDDTPTPTQFLFEDKPLITFEDNSVLIVSAKVKISYSMQNFVHFSFQDPTNIKDIKTDSISPIIRVYGYEITISGLSNKELVTVNKIDGTTVFRGHSHKEGNLTITLTPGIFIITIERRSFKIIL